MKKELQAIAKALHEPAFGQSAETSIYNVRKQLALLLDLLIADCAEPDLARPEFPPNRDGHGNPILSQFDEGELPPHIIDCARQVDRWCRKHGKRDWQIAGVCDQRFALRLTQAEERLAKARELIADLANFTGLGHSMQVRIAAILNA